MLDLSQFLCSLISKLIAAPVTGARIVSGRFAHGVNAHLQLRSGRSGLTLAEKLDRWTCLQGGCTRGFE